LDYPSGLDELDGFLWQAGRHHVIAPREDAAVLEQLREPRMLERARELLGKEEWAIIALERIGYARRDQETAELLLDFAANAKKKDDAGTALGGLRNLSPPSPLSGQQLAGLIRHPDWHVWHEALRCVHLVPPDDVEPAVLDRLDADKYGLVYVALALRHLTSDASLNALEHVFAEAPDMDTRTVSFWSLAHRLGSGALPYAHELAGARRIEEKRAASQFLAEHGDERDIPFMAGRLKTRSTKWLPPEESWVVPFLRRFESVPEVATALRAFERRQ
jgi:hypothetical protein